MANKNITLMGDRIEVYRDFSINLLSCICEFYLDKSTLNNATDVRNHFNWCYNRVNQEFMKENISFDENDKLKDYLYSYYEPNFYNNQSFFDKDDIKINIYNDFWKSIFNTDNMAKNLDTTKILVELYLLFDDSINNNKKEKTTCING